MPLAIGETREVWGSGSKPYILKNCDGTVWSCTCPSWRNKGGSVMRTCKHLIALRSKAAEDARLAGVLATQVARPEVAPVAHKVQENPSAPDALPFETDKAKRLNEYGGFVPFSDQEKAQMCAREEARLGRKLRQDEKTDLFGPPLLLANIVESDFDPTGWWVSLKKDGLRALWTGWRFVSRGGTPYSAPSWFTASLPKMPLDGELYLGRDMLEATNSIVRSAGVDNGWKKITFVVFDAPAHPGTFEQRLEMLQSLTVPAHVEILAQHRCKGRVEFDAELDQVTAANEEGLMLRKPGSAYEGRRSSTLLKAKKFFDLEVTVIGYESGKGKHKGKLGGLVVRMDDGKTFNVGTGLTDRERDNPPPIGCRVTVSFTSRTRYGIPKCAAFVAVRAE